VISRNTGGYQFPSWTVRVFPWQLELHIRLWELWRSEIEAIISKLQLWFSVEAPSLV
jgi:hypothetical protein